MYWIFLIINRMMHTMKLLTTLFFINIYLLSIASAYTLKDQDLTPYEFQRYVRPQLKSILQDYKSLILALNPDSNYLKEDIKTFRSLISMASKIHLSCNNFSSPECFEQLSTLHRKHLELYQVQEKNLNKNSPLRRSNSEVDTQLQNWKLQEELRQHILNSFFKLDLAVLEYQLKEKVTLSPSEVLNSLEKSYIMFNILLLNNIKMEFKDSLHAFWLSFIRPVYKHVLIQNNQDYFQRNITEINFRLNEINAYLTKRAAGVPKQAVTMIKIIHNRWNNILKVTLRPLP